MKVIVQDIETGEYLADSGEWVTTPAEARDFLTLLRAYNFAKETISGRFQVLLYCPEDQYSACIIEGEGLVDSLTKSSSTMTQVKTAPFVRKAAHKMNSAWSQFSRFNWVGNELN